MELGGSNKQGAAPNPSIGNGDMEHNNAALRAGNDSHTLFVI